MSEVKDYSLEETILAYVNASVGNGGIRPANLVDRIVNWHSWKWRVNGVETVTRKEISDEIVRLIDAERIRVETVVPVWRRDGYLVLLPIEEAK